jgi:hypothetical protein
VVLIQHLDLIQQTECRAVVNDFKGELVERFYRPGQDLILNPLDARGLGWTLFNELLSKADLTAIAGSLIPPAKGEDRFWSAAAQDVLRGLMAYCYQYQKRTNIDLWKAITSSIGHSGHVPVNHIVSGRLAIENHLGHSLSRASRIP